MSSILITQQTYSYKPSSDTTNLGSLSKQISEKENDVFRLITNMGLQKKFRFPDLGFRAPMLYL